MFGPHAGLVMTANEVPAGGVKNCQPAWLTVDGVPAVFVSLSGLVRSFQPILTLKPSSHLDLTRGSLASDFCLDVGRL